MTPSDQRPRSSLRTLILVVGGGLGLALVLMGVLFVQAGLDAREEFTEASEDFLEEQLIANRITQGVMRQLATASAFSEDPGPEIRAEFQTSGDEVYDQIRRYLFFNLSPGARVEIERMREEHQELEVLAAQTQELFSRGQIPEAEAARGRLIAQAFNLLEALESFVVLRDAELASIRERQDEAFTRLFYGGILGSVLTGLTALILAILLHRRVAQPLFRMAHATEQMAAGDLSVRVPPGNDQELHQLSTGFNRMAESLEATTRQLEDRNRELSRALARIQKTQDELVQTEKLSAMGRMAAGLAHELNNPLASVLGFGELLKGRLISSPDPESGELEAEFVRPIVEEAARAQHLIRNFLHFSRRASSELGPVPLREPLERVLSMREYSFAQAGLALDVGEIPDVWVRADPHMLQSVILNVVNNAFQALVDRPPTATDAGLSVWGEEHGDRVRLCFDDDGPGLSEPDRIFEPFFTTKPVGEGTGLGLAVAHRFMETFGGRITGENRAGGGARFVLELPVEEPSPPKTEPAGDPAELAPPSDPLPAGLRVLVVEDEEPLRRLQARILARLDAEVLLAGDGAEARRILESREVDVVVSDVRMPGESGLDLYRWTLKNRPRLARHFLFVTGDIGAPELASLAEERPGYLLHKPFEVEEYLARIRLVVTRATGPGESPIDPAFGSHSGEVAPYSGAPGAVSEERG